MYASTRKNPFPILPDSYVHLVHGSCVLITLNATPTLRKTSSHRKRGAHAYPKKKTGQEAIQHTHAPFGPPFPPSLFCFSASRPPSLQQPLPTFFCFVSVLPTLDPSLCLASLTRPPPDQCRRHHRHQPRLRLSFSSLLLSQTDKRHARDRRRGRSKTPPTTTTGRQVGTQATAQDNLHTRVTFHPCPLRTEARTWGHPFMRASEMEDHHAPLPLSGATGTFRSYGTYTYDVHEFDRMRKEDLASSVRQRFTKRSHTVIMGGENFGAGVQDSLEDIFARANEATPMYEKLGKVEGIANTLHTSLKNGVDGNTVEARRAFFGKNALPEEP
ncbi:vacuolar-type Ca2+-ATPase, putative, partial [Leishmania donovani]